MASAAPPDAAPPDAAAALARKFTLMRSEPKIFQYVITAGSEVKHFNQISPLPKYVRVMQQFLSRWGGWKGLQKELAEKGLCLYLKVEQASDVYGVYTVRPVENAEETMKKKLGLKPTDIEESIKRLEDSGPGRLTMLVCVKGLQSDLGPSLPAHATVLVLADDLPEGQENGEGE